MTIEQAYIECEEVIKKASKTFYTAFKDLPLAKRNGIYAIYAFCRIADDTIDVYDSIDQLSELTKEFEQFEIAFKNNESYKGSNSIFIALEDTFNKFNLDFEPFKHMLIGQHLDSNFKIPEDFAQLDEYCYYVAGTVGLMLSPILATKNHKLLRDASINLGHAMQLTNILRDIGEDYDNGRIYIPKDLINNAPDFMNALKSKKVNNDFIHIWETIALISEKLYDDFSPYLALFDEDSQVPLSNAAYYYRKILSSVRQQNYDCLTQRCFVKL